MRKDSDYQFAGYIIHRCSNVYYIRRPDQTRLEALDHPCYSLQEAYERIIELRIRENPHWRPKLCKRWQKIYEYLDLQQKIPVEVPNELPTEQTADLDDMAPFFELNQA